MNQLFIMRLDGQRYALRLEDVERVVRIPALVPEPRSGGEFEGGNRKAEGFD